MLRKVKLVGHIGKRFGSEYEFDVNTPAEAVRALCSQVKGFKEYLQEGEGKEQLFKIVVGETELEDLQNSMKSSCTGDISIVPVTDAAGSDFLKIVAGATLLYFSGGSFGYELIMMTGSSSVLGLATMVGAGLILSGISGILMKPPTQRNTVEVEKNASYLFNGAVNTTQQGNPIPIGYGRLKIGSQVISTEIKNAQVAI